MEPQETLSLMHARKSYLRLGWSLVVLEVGAQIGAVLIALLGAVLASAGHDVSGTWWYFLLSNFLPIYLFGMPFALLILRRAIRSPTAWPADLRKTCWICLRRKTRR